METSVQRNMPRLVVCAAMRYPDGFIITGARHYDSVMRSQLKAAGREAVRYRHAEVEQGFIDQKCVFMDREEAMEVAKAAGQIRRWIANGIHETDLYSEHLY